MSEDAKKCPKCGGDLTFGYGLAGGGEIGGYDLCEADGCDYFYKPNGGEPNCFVFGPPEEEEP